MTEKNTSDLLKLSF